ncbi:MAG: GMC family oxidoreductase N-terminal domain-containing protein [Deltaproteobacteria bacterium]
MGRFVGHRVLGIAFAVFGPPACSADLTVEAPLAPHACGASTGPHAHDYVVVGSGAGGGPLAARLARAGCRVLLLEAGADVGGRLEYQVPAMHALSTEHEATAWSFFVGHHADPSIDREDSKYTDAGILYPRGSALGGSTAVNALVTIRPSPSDWNRLAQITGEAGFRAANMDGYYGRVREWLDVELPSPELAASDAKISDYLMAAATAFANDEGAPTIDGLPENTRGAGALHSLLAHDVNDALADGETTGLFRLPLATSAGKRNGTREFLVDTAAEGYPLEIRTGAFVTRVLFERLSAPTAVGVEYHRGAKLYGASIGARGASEGVEVAYANNEVILAAGAFNSPQLLMLSGVGDPEHLAAHSIDVVAARPGVGRNLQDRNEVAVVTEFDEAIDTVAPCSLGEAEEDDPCLEAWTEGQGVYRTTGFLGTVLKRSTPDVALADLQVFGSPGDARGYYPGYSNDALARDDRFSWLVLKAHTENRDGRVSLVSRDPFTRPDIRFNYFDEANPLADPDLKAVVEGVKFVREIIEEMRDDYDEDDLVEIWPGPEVSTDEAIGEWVRRETWGHHASCSNKMGLVDDPMAVVDPSFRVIGVDRLRVVDASVFPEIPGTFIAVPTFMLSERAADVILEGL